MFDFTREIAQESAGLRDFTALVAARNRVLDLEFPRAVARAGWRLLRRGDIFDPAAVTHAIVVGVGTYSELDLNALDALLEKVNHYPAQVFSFSVDECPDTGQLALFMPGVQRPLQTPFLAEYKNGQLKQFLEGKKAREWMGAVTPESPS